MSVSTSRLRVRSVPPAAAVPLFAAVCALAFLSGCANATRHPAARHANSDQAGGTNFKPVPTPGGEVFVRAQYPYSVVVGGVYTPEELSRARRTDRVVREHYQGFGDRPAFQKAAKDMLVYVSYRKHDRVYWTRKRHFVKRGELVLSDGGKLARARCGNQLSEKPQGPVENGEEPDEDVLAGPEVPPTLQASSAITPPELSDASSYVAPPGFSDYPLVATPVKGGTVDITAGGPAAASYPSFPNALTRTAFGAPANDIPVAQNGTAAPVAKSEAAGLPLGTTAVGGGNVAPNGTPSEGVPTFEVPFVPPRSPLAPVPEPATTKTMWLALLGGLACLTIRKFAGTR